MLSVIFGHHVTIRVYCVHWSQTASPVLSAGVEKKYSDGMDEARGSVLFQLINPHSRPDKTIGPCIFPVKWVGTGNVDTLLGLNSNGICPLFAWTTDNYQSYRDCSAKSTYVASSSALHTLTVEVRLINCKILIIGRVKGEYIFCKGEILWYF